MKNTQEVQSKSIIEKRYKEKSQYCRLDFKSSKEHIW